jgi:hypothetical protein
MKNRKPRRWRTVFGRPGEPVAFIEEDEEGGTWSAYVGGLQCGNFINEAAARAFVEKTMAMSDTDRDTER